MRRHVVLTALLALLAAPAAAQGQEPVVYSSLPLQGAARPQTVDIVRGIRLALERAGTPVRYVSLDDSTRAAGTWTPEAVARNARRAATDPRTIAYIGEFNSGASAISIPMLNEAGILQVSPSNTAVGLTVGGPGAEPGEPDRYYPTGRRTFGRVIPNDRVQGAAAAVAIRDAGVRRLLVVHDGETYGRGLARLTRDAARGRGLEVAGLRRLARAGRNARRLAAEARRRGADGVFYGGITANGAPRLWRALARIPDLRLFAGDGVAESRFARRIPRSTKRRTRVMVATLDREAYPEPGQEVFAALGGSPDPYALYGYEAMSVILDALARGGRDRAAVVDAFFATRDRDSVLGRYSIDPLGDTTLMQYGVYRPVADGFIFDRAVDASAP